MKTIPLTQGKEALVDDSDYEAVKAFHWSTSKVGRRFYAVSNVRKPDGKKTTQSLHHFLMPGVVRVDHQDGNGLNNQKHNLRPATNRQNLQGFRRKPPAVTSKFRGVCWHRQYRKWQAQIKIDGKQTWLGRFTVEADAAHAYDTAAREHFGDFASPNFPLTTASS